MSGSTSYAKTVGGKLKLKGGISLSGAAKAPAAAGVKRPREDDGAAAASSSAAAASSSSAAAPAPAPAPAQRLAGVGRLITSGTTVHGIDTKFMEQLALGDAIQTNPLSQKDEVRVVKMVLSDKSAGINAPFSSDLVTGTAFHVLKLPKAAVDPGAAAAAAAEKARQEERATFGAYAGDGGTKLTYVVKKEGVYGGYKTVTETVASAGKGLTREELLDRRSKSKSDKFC